MYQLLLQHEGKILDVLKYLFPLCISFSQQLISKEAEIKQVFFKSWQQFGYPLVAQNRIPVTKTCVSLIAHTLP